MNVVVEGIDILNEKRADYERPILPTLLAKLVPQFHPGFSAQSLWGNN